MEHTLAEFHEYVAAVAGAADLSIRAEKVYCLGDVCYMNPDIMFHASVRRTLFNVFEGFFALLKSGTIPLDVRDRVNRIYGMLLETRRWLEKDPRCQF
jgi:hypothetical protein